MNEHSLIFSRSGGPDKLYRVSPLLFPQYQLANAYQLPERRDLPLEGLELRFETFDFGFANPGNIITPNDTAYFGIAFGRNFLATMITGCGVPQGQAALPAAGAPGTKVTPTFLFNFQHENAKGVIRQWSNKPLTDIEGVGTAEEPLMFKSPAFIAQGDTLTCMMQNVSNCNLMAQIVLVGGEFA